MLNKNAKRERSPKKQSPANTLIKKTPYWIHLSTEKGEGTQKMYRT
jgi:hypothetical protein